MSCAQAAEPTPALPEKHFAFFDKYCLECHDSLTEKGKVNLEDIPFQVTTIEEAELWQKVLNSMNSGEMPPEDEKQPEQQEKADFLDALAQTMVAARQTLSDTGGEITMRRLNRREYQNSIEYLTGVQVDASSLPADGGSGTFDTEGASQFISSDQIEQYLKLGRSAIDELFERQAAMGQESRTFRVEPENTVNVQSRENMAKQEEVQERYLLWKAEVDKAALLPENEAVLAQLREKYKLDDLTDNLRLYQNANLLNSAPDPTKFGFRDANAASFSYQGGYGRTHAYMKQYLEFPNSDRGTYLKLAWAIQRIDVTPKPEDIPPGTYKLRIRAGSVEGSDPSRHFIEVGHPQRVNQVPFGFTSKPIASLQVTGTEVNPEIIETTVVISSDTPREFGIQERVPADSKKTISREFYAHKRENGYGTPPAIWVDWIELEGPLSNSVVTASKTHRVELEKTVNVKNLEIIKSQEKKYKEKWLPWKEGVEKAAKDPANQEVMAELRKNHPALDADPFQLYRNAERLKGAPDPTKFGFGDPINAIAHYRSIWRQLDYMKHYAGLPHNDQGAYLKLSSGIQRFDVSPDPKDMPPGSYKLRIRAGAVEGSDPSRHFIEIGHPQRRTATSLGFSKLLSTRQISGTIQNPQIIEVNIEIGANTPREVGIQERQPKSGKLLRKEFDRHKKENGYGTPPAIWVDWIELVGPIQDTEVTESKIHRIEPEKTINPANEEEIAQIEDQYARSAEWQKGVDEAAKTPENQAKIAEIRKTEPKINHPQWFYAYADRLEGTPDARDFGFTDAQKAAASDPEGDRRNLAYHKHYAGLPHRDHGTYLKVAHGTGRVIVAPEKLPVGSYTLRVAAAAVEGSPAGRHFIEVGHPQREIEVRNWGLEGQPISSHQVTGTIEKPQVIEIPLEVGTDTIKEFAIQEKQPNNGNLKALWNAHNALKAENGYGHPPAIWIDWVELEGPLPKVDITESKIHRVEPELTINPDNEKFIKRIEDAHERFAKWQKGVDIAAATPENQAIIAEIAKKEDRIKHPVFFYRYADRLKGTPDAKDFGFVDAPNASAYNPDRSTHNITYHKHYASLPHRDTGTYLKPTKGAGRVIVSPEKLPLGNYTLRVRVGAVEGSDPGRHFIQVGHPQRQRLNLDWGLGDGPISTNQVSGTIAEPQIIEIPIEVGPDTPREFAVQEKQPNNGNVTALWGTFNAAKKENGYGIPPAIWIDWVELEGPHPKVKITESKTHRVEPELTINPRNEKEIEKMEDAFERYAQWQKGVDEVAKTPENQAIIAEIAKKEPDILDPLRFYQFADRLKGAPDARDFGFEDVRAPRSANRDWPNLHAYYKHYADLPHRDTGSYLKPTKGTGRVIVSPEKLPIGNYTLRMRAGAVEGSDPGRHFIDVGHPQRTYTGIDWDWGLEGRPISTNQVTGTIAEPQVIEIPIEVGPNTLREFAVQEKQPNNGNMKALWGTYNAAKKKNGFGIPPAIWIDWVELEGPHPAKPTIWTQRREVEDHANAKVGGTYRGYHVRGNEKAQTFLKTGEPQEGISDDQEAKFRIRAYEENGPTFRRYLEDPLTQSGSYLTISNLNKEEYIALPPEHPSGWKETKHVVETLPPGDYKLRFHIGAVEGTPTDRHFVDLGAVPEKNQFNHLSTFQITGTTDEAQTIEVPVTLTADGPRKFALREKRDPKNDLKAYRAARAKTGVGPKPALWIDWVEWEGPFKVSSDDSTFTDWWVSPQTTPDESARARQILEQFAFNAYRGVGPESEFVDHLSGIFETRRSEGDPFDVAIRLPLSVILASPGFLYLNEPADENERRELTDRELAVRLAYFLWSSPPDRELLGLASREELSNPDILRGQVDRLIAESRSDEFVAGFLHQWLDMERLDFFQFDTTLHREFDESTRSAARQEVYHSFAHLLRDPEGGRLGKLLKSDTVFINGLLATYYGIDGVTGDQFQQVALPAESPRGGLLGMAAIHAMGSDGIESSPVERGAWVLRHLLNDPPPPAPPNVPQLSRLAEEPLNTRQKLAAHMEEAQCASCHRKIDPIGFGLENFDAAGKWRTEEHHDKKLKWEIDPSGAFHNGPEFADYFEMRDLIADREGDFARGFTEHLIGYGLGRPFGFTDVDLAIEIVGAAKEEDFAVSEFIQALVQSEPFRRK